MGLRLLQPFPLASLNVLLRHEADLPAVSPSNLGISKTGGQRSRWRGAEIRLRSATDDLEDTTIYPLHPSRVDIRVGAARLKETLGVQNRKVSRNADNAGERNPGNSKA